MTRPGWVRAPWAGCVNPVVLCSVSCRFQIPRDDYDRVKLCMHKLASRAKTPSLARGRSDGFYRLEAVELTRPLPQLDPGSLKFSVNSEILPPPTSPSHSLIRRLPLAGTLETCLERLRGSVGLLSHSNSFDKQGRGDDMRLR
jgi:hypothetical protein